jgi:hypothetical protein
VLAAEIYPLLVLFQVPDPDSAPAPAAAVSPEWLLLRCTTYRAYAAKISNKIEVLRAVSHREQ